MNIYTELMGLYLLDTNVVLRLMDRHAPEHLVCRRAIERLRIQGESLCLAPQVLVEFWAVATRPPQNNGFGWTPDYTFEQVSIYVSFSPCILKNPNSSTND